MSFNGDLYPTDEGTNLTTKGDLHGYSTENTRVAVGSNNTVLTADSTQSAGIKWGTAGGVNTNSLVASLISRNGYNEYKLC